MPSTGIWRRACRPLETCGVSSWPANSRQRLRTARMWQSRRGNIWPKNPSLESGHESGRILPQIRMVEAGWSALSLTRFFICWRNQEASSEKLLHLQLRIVRVIGHHRLPAASAPVFPSAFISAHQRLNFFPCVPWLVSVVSAPSVVKNSSVSCAFSRPSHPRSSAYIRG